jgi:hypothetical protein
MKSGGEIPPDFIAPSARLTAEKALVLCGIFGIVTDKEQLLAQPC